ncbi:preprotein translocase subunit YajC [Candidatus Epulonipiscium fishelsonii]|uniref:Preprotein translocase subunit YajC n=1 Tax=Candidatus Epulonipiscium fishelsonii TaxID=77094 RepID=A0ACC8X9J2_9FIRM|nr:preprotein translocase subunit YajC [Epulopiscium sp. SCG-B11WGA-EpuloA1]ONI41727.1 preprotein translocase subunit YajC [Epulopiscium sp. SCG-B05WGA-EpuloA1]
MSQILFTAGYMIFLFGVMWFFLIRPQKKREQQTRDMQNSIKVGTNVLTTSGIYGKVVDIINDLFIVEIGLNKGIRVPIKKIAIVGVEVPELTVRKSVPAPAIASEPEDEEYDEDDDEYEEDDDDSYDDDGDDSNHGNNNSSSNSN